MELNNSSPLPGFMFYPDDFTGDTSLMSCSLAAIGAWSILLCRMHKAPAYGYLTLLKQNPEQSPDQKVITAEIVALKGDKLARIVGRSISELQPLLDELIDAGVMKIDPKTQIFYCKRMVSDHALRLIRKAAGAAGGHATQEKNKGGFDKAKTGANGDQKTGNENESGNEIVNGNVIPGENVLQSQKEKGKTTRTPRKKATPPVSPEEPEKPKSIFTKCMDLYFDFFRRPDIGGTEPKIGGRDGKALKDLVAHLSGIARSKGMQEQSVDEFVIQCLVVIFQAWNYQEDFIRKQIDLYQIANNINRIIVRLKTLQNERNNETGGNSVAGTGKTNPGNVSDQSLFASISAKFGGQ